MEKRAYNISEAIKTKSISEGKTKSSNEVTKTKGPEGPFVIAEKNQKLATCCRGVFIKSTMSTRI